MNQHNLTIVRNFLTHQKNAQADQALALIYQMSTNFSGHDN